MAAMQGGYLLTQADHDVAPMATALDMALAHIESLTTTAIPGKAKRVAAQSLTAARLRSAIDAGAAVLEPRSTDDFAWGHLRGGLNVGFNGSEAVSAAEVCDPDETVAVIVY